MSRQPVAPYLMAQVVLMQEQGMNNLQARIEELEQELASQAQAQTQSSGFLGGLFGGSKPQPARPGRPGHGAATGQLAAVGVTARPRAWRCSLG